MLNRLLLGTRVVRAAVLLVTFLSYTFLLLRRMRLNKLHQIEIQTRLSAQPDNSLHSEHARWRQSYKLMLVNQYCRDSSAGNPTGLSAIFQSSANRQQRCVISTRLLSESSRLPPRDRLFRVFYSVVFGVLGFDLVKYMLVSLLKYPALANFRFLDCYLIGRLSLNGRTVEVVGNFFVAGTIMLILWPAIEVISKGNLMRFDVFEFLLCDHKYLLDKEAAALDRQTKEMQLAAAGRPRESFNVESLLEFINKFQVNNRSSTLGEATTAREFTGAGDGFCCFYRPNRTAQAWLTLSRRLVLYLAASYTVILLATPLVFTMSYPLIVSKNGFMLQYRHCADWALRQRDSASSASIYAFLVELPANRSLDEQLASIERKPFMPWTDFCPFNWYHSIRTLYTVLATYLFYYGMANLLIINAAFALMMSTDLLIYSAALDRRLKRLAEEQHLRISRHYQRSVAVKGPAQQQGSRRASPLNLLTSLSAKINQLQALLVDNFELLTAYDRFASLLSAMTVVIWFGYSLLISTWVFLPAEFSSAHRLEWYVIHVYGSLHAFIILSSFARVRNANRALYPLITNAAALDYCGCLVQRRRWQTIMCYYSPKSLYCFRAMQSIELSWLFLFKLTAWLFSALLVVSTFYSAYRVAE